MSSTKITKRYLAYCAETQNQMCQNAIINEKHTYIILTPLNPLQ